MKRVLITGKNSYIGNSIGNWLGKEPNKYIVDFISLKGNNWEQADFSSYDVILHVAGIAHVSTDQRLKDSYYQVNRDLALKLAIKSKKEGVEHFVFFSSIIIYGESSKDEKIITIDTQPNPSNFYGDSKLQAEKGLTKIFTDNLTLTILRLPFVYGKNSKGNYPLLSRIAELTPIFPLFFNKRSMLHIDNLCEFVKAIIDHEKKGVFFPQNAEYVETSELVRTIAEVKGRKILFTKIFNPLIMLSMRFSMVKKAFGNLVYDKSMSVYDFANYQIRDLKESIILTEKD